MIRSVILSLAFVGSFALAGCEEPAKGPAPATPAAATATTAPKAATADVKAPGDAKLGDTTRCPVSGEEFVVTENSPHVEYQGKTYYTCCPHCKEKVEADPEKYLKAKN